MIESEISKGMAVSGGVVIAALTAVIAFAWSRGGEEITRIEFVGTELDNPAHPNVWFRGHEVLVNAVGFSGDGRRFASTSQDAIYVWSVDSARVVGTYRGHPGASRDVVLDHEGRRGIARGGEGISIWTIAEDGAITTDTLLGPEDRIHALGFQAGGRAVGAGSPAPNRDSLLVWDLRTEEVLAGWQLPGAVMRVSFDDSGTVLVAADRDGAAYLVRIDSDAVTALGEGTSARSEPVGIDGAATTVVWAASDSTARVHDLTGVRPDRLVSLSAPLRLFDVGPNGMLLLPQGDGIDIDTTVEGARRIHLPMAGFGRGVSSVAISPDGTGFATGMRDGSVLLWDIPLAEDLVRQGIYTPRVPREPLQASDECQTVSPVLFGIESPVPDGNDFLDPPDFRIAGVLEYSTFRTYCYSAKNPESSSGGATSITLDISADRGPSPPRLISTGPAEEFARRRGLEPRVPLIEYGAISPDGWDAYVAGGEIVWDLSGNVGFFGSDSVPPGGTVHGLGLRSSYLPGLRRVSVEPTAHACCSEPLGDQEEFLPWPQSFKVSSWAVAPRYPASDMTIEILAEQTSAVCTDPLWIRDPVLCETLITAIAEREGTDLRRALADYIGILDDVRLSGEDVRSDAFWLLSINAAHLAGRF